MAGGVPPDPAEGAEAVHVATRSQVTRMSVGETQVVRKQPQGPDAPQSYTSPSATTAPAGRT